MANPQPILIRRVLNSAVPDPDFAGDQTPPMETTDVTGVNAALFFAVGCDGTSAMGGTHELEVVAVRPVTALPGGPTPELEQALWVLGRAANLTNGAVLPVDLRGAADIFVRVVATSHPGSTHLDVYMLPSG